MRDAQVLLLVTYRLTAGYFRRYLAEL